MRQNRLKMDHYLADGGIHQQKTFPPHGSVFLKRRSSTFLELILSIL